MNIEITKWGGRLGNNIQQLVNAIQVAIYYDYNLKIPDHWAFNTNYIIINDSVKENDDYNKDIIADGNGRWGDFFFAGRIKNIDSKLFNLNVDKSISILKSIFKITTDISLNDKELVIHIRSGDIFTSPPNSSVYIMPPLSFYQRIIDKEDFRNIYIIAENKKNPVIDKLLDLYPKIIFKKQSLQNDIKLLLSSKNVVESYGTFTNSLLLLSDNIHNIYRPSYQITSKLLLSEKKKITINEYDLKEYHRKLSPWRRSKEQLEMLLNYQM